METELAIFGAPLLAGAAWVLDRAERLRRDVARAVEGTIRDLSRMREGLVGIEGRVTAEGAPLVDPVSLAGQPGAFRGTADRFRIRAVRGMPFVVSASPEATLLDGFRRTAHRALVLGAGAFLGGAALLLAAIG